MVPRFDAISASTVFSAYDSRVVKVDYRYETNFRSSFKICLAYGV